MASLIGTILVENRPADSLIPDPLNPRRHSAVHIGQVAASIREFGWTQPILADVNIRAGHARQLAAKLIYSEGETIRLPNGEELPAGSVPVIDCTGWSEAQIRAYVIADNQLTAGGDWDEAMLRAQIDELMALDFDMEAIGLGEEELARMRAAGEESGRSPRMGSLSEEFLIPPFSVLNAREGWWQDRKRGWLALGIESEIGRGENLLRMSETILEPDPAKREKGRRGLLYVTSDYDRPDLDDASRKILGGARRGKAAVLGEGLGGNAGGGKELGHYHGKAQAFQTGAKVGHGGMAEQMGMPRRAQAIGAAAWVGEKVASGELDSPDGKGGTGIEKLAGGGTSIFDPVLCELAYRWFCPPDGQVLDPFAGGSVRGIVAAKLGRSYLGIDLRPEQCEANLDQAARICNESVPNPVWICGDASSALPGLDDAYLADFVFSCPPYGALEIYSDDPADLSNLDPEEFDIAYERIIRRALDRLKPDRFACFVVGDYRDKRGLYRNFVSKTIGAFRAAGAELYNEIILITAAGSLAIRAGKQFRTTRKVGKTHQNVLIFVKGDPRKATEACGPVDVEAALALFAEEIEGAGQADEGPTPEGDACFVKVSAACARQQFTQCGPLCIETNGCHGNCCDAPSRPSGCLITINPRERERIETLGGVVVDGLLQPKGGEKGCPFKRAGLCGIHDIGKPFGCIASPFTLNPAGTLIIRNRYRLLPCYRGPGPKEPAYRAYRASLDLIFGPEEAERLCDHFEAGGGDIMARIDPDIRAELIENDDIKRQAKGRLGGEV